MEQASGPSKLPAWQRGVAALGIAGVYVQIGLMLAGLGLETGTHGALEGIWFVLQIGVALATMIAAFGLLRPQDRRAAALGFVHVALLSLLLLSAWGILPVALPSTPADFRALILPMVALSFTTQALAHGTAGPNGECRRVPVG